MADSEAVKSLKCLIFASIISADNDEYSEEVKQEIISRYHSQKGEQPLDWDIILDPLGDDKYKYMKVLTA